MFQTILVPLDGSPLSERAIPTASTLAVTTGARLTLVRVVAAPNVSGTETAGALALESDEAAAYLRGLASRFAEQDLVTEIALPSASPAEGILAEAGRRPADLIVMSTHGRSGLGRWVYGSTTQAVLARSLAPVLLVRGAAPAVPLISNAARSKILVPLDGSTYAEDALPYAIGLARALDAKLLLLRTFTPTEPGGPELAFMGPAVQRDVAEQERFDAETYLRAVEARLGAYGVRARAMIHLGPAAEAILEVSRSAGVVIVVMATHGRDGLGRLPFGSVTTQILHRGELPLLLVRPIGLANARPTEGVDSYALS